ncbi:MAG: hypothetical protein M1333_04045 [Patescibacteria group bacterium]|nr:hypothetical protein [Patescibacteria group bacterium]
METKIENKEDVGGTERSKESIHFGHLGIILACAVLLSGVMFMKNGFTLPKFHSTPVAQYTYEQAHAEALAEAGRSDQNYGNDSETQLAMLDPSLGEGQVAGASTGTLADMGIQPAEEIWPQASLDQIPLKLIKNASTEQMQGYKEQLDQVETYYDSTGIFSSLDSEDRALLESTATRAYTLGSALLAMDVPEQFSEYHKYKIISYMQIKALLDGQLGKSGAMDDKEASLQIFSLLDKITRLKAEMLNKYNFEL